MPAIKCIIIDDEPIGLEIMENFAKEINFLKVVAVCEDAFEALEILEGNQIDLLITDIQMPKINGLELVRSLSSPPVIIFVTAHDQFAVNSFELGVADYLLKPVSFDRFLKAINKAKMQIEMRKNVSIHSNAEMVDYIFIKANKKLNKIVYGNIMYIQSSDDFIKIFTADQNQPLIVYLNLKSIEEKLPTNQFVRIHNSYLVSINAVKAVMGNTVELTNAQLLPVSKNYKDGLFAVLQIQKTQ
ncbi:MAG TPA: LytTR family DNA-binding domain-containing protein [Hanamia sp.]|nr:LytTR family DNA-binding domain-containing protein [Hanamia sp.]